MSYFTIPTDETSVGNTSEVVLTSGSTFTGAAEQNTYPDVMVSCHTDKSGRLDFDFSNDGINWNTFPSSGFTVTANIHEFHTAVKGGRHFRVRLTNTSADTQGFLRLYTYYGKYRQGNAPINQSIGADSDAIITRGIITGETDGGSFKNVPVDASGHLEMAIHDPLLPFGSIHTENLTPVFQTDAVYGLNAEQVVWGSTISGEASTSASMFKCSTGASLYSQAFIQSRRRLRYRAGQGVVGKFTAQFSPAVDAAYQVVGFGHAEDGVYMATSGSSFGILYSSHGIREQVLLNVTTPSSNTENVDIILNSVSNSIAVTNSANSNTTAYELSRGVYSGWKAEPTGSAILFTKDSVGKTTGQFTANGTSFAGSYVSLQSGSATTETFISQSEWNGDILDGNGASGVVLNYQTGNVYEVGIQYLGFGSVYFKAETNSSTGNNSTFTTIHTLAFPNSRSIPSFGNPSFPFSMAAYSAGSTTDLTPTVGSFAGFIEGSKSLTGNRFSYRNTVASVSTSVYTSIFTIMNSRRYGNRTNQSIVNLLNIGYGARLSNTAYGELVVIKNGTLVGPAQFRRYDSNSCTLFDTASTSVTFSNNNQNLFTLPLVETSQGGFTFTQEVDLQPGESITIAARLQTGTATFLTTTLNTIEDQ